MTATRVLLIDGLLRRVSIDGPSMAQVLCGASCEVICDDCGFVFLCDAAYLPKDRLAVCPNCGYTKNDLDRARWLPPDRVLIDRWPVIWRKPRRGEIVAAAPAGSHDLVVKRVAGLPGERLAIRDGDLYSSDEIIRKTAAELKQVRILIHDNDYQPRERRSTTPRWRPQPDNASSDNANWEAQGTGFRLEQKPGDRGSWKWLEYEHWACTADARLRGVAAPVTDNDGYNQGELHRPLNPVHDVLFSCWLRTSGTGQLAFAAVDGADRLELTIDPEHQVLVRGGDKTLLQRRIDLDFSRHTDVEFGLCDQQLLLVVGGRTIVRLPYERTEGSSNDVLHPLAIGGDSLEVEVDRLRVWRDIYYLGPQGLPQPWTAEGPLSRDQYLLLGDNQPVSVDSRQWQTAAVASRSIVGRVHRFPLGSR